MFKKYTVANWMEDHDIHYTAEANRYEVGQELTYAQAQAIIRMIRQGMGFMGEHPIQQNDWRRSCDTYLALYYLLTITPMFLTWAQV